jgi:hypothetical protein
MSLHLELKWVPDLRFQHPAALLVSGSTGAGKTHWVKLLIENDGIKGDIKKIYYFMPILENINISPNADQQLFLMEGMPTRSWVDDTFKVNEDAKTIIVVDDQFSKCVKDEVIEHLLTFGRRHYGLSLIFIAQNFYEKSKNARTLR